MKTFSIATIALFLGGALVALAPTGTAAIYGCVQDVDPGLPLYNGQCFGVVTSPPFCVGLSGLANAGQCVLQPLPPRGVCYDGQQVVGTVCTVNVPRPPENPIVCVGDYAPLRDSWGTPPTCAVNTAVVGVRFVDCGDSYALWIGNAQSACMYGLP